MERKQTQRQIEMNVAALKQNGWAQCEIDAAVNGLHRDDALELLERLVQKLSA